MKIRFRWALRWFHVILGIPIAGYVYSPFKQIPNYAPAVRYFFFPVLVLSGLWMWKGHIVLRLIGFGPAQQQAAAKR